MPVLDAVTKDVITVLGLFGNVQEILRHCNSVTISPPAGG